MYDFYSNRKHCNAASILKGYHGVVHSDKYGAYVELALAKQFDRCPCWVHIRRKFFEAEAGDQNFRTWIMDRIGKIFALEEQVWLCSAEVRQQIAKVLLISDQAVREHVQGYKASHKLKPENGGSEEKLSEL